MGQVIASFCMIRILFWRMLLNNFFYAFFRKGCRFVNRSITEKASFLVCSVLKLYTGFKFKDDKASKNMLPSQYLVISNHQSILDIVVYMRFLKQDAMKYMAKYELINHVPLVSVMLKTGDHCIVKRQNSPSQAMKAVDNFAIKVKKNGYIPVIFPEGTRSRDGDLRTFHSAGFRRFLNVAPMPVAVCAIDGGYKISSLRSFFRNIKGMGYKVKVLKVFPPPTTKEEQLKVLEEGKTLIEEQLKKWRENTETTSK